MILLRFILAFFPLFCLTDPGEVPEILSDSEANYDFDHLKKNASHYDSLINSKAIVMGKFGYEKLRENTNLNNILLVIDFTKPSDHKRMYIIDMNSDRLLHESHVAHGKNSGLVYPTAFSNEKNTNRSSLGFYRTAETYFGKHGLSLRLDGLEEGINNNARERAIVIHSAKYASKAFIEKYGRLGRSFGCPSLPEDKYEETIDLIKEGALLFIYYPESKYLKESKIITSD